MSSHRWLLACCILGSAGGCSTQLQGLHDDPIELAVLPPAEGPPVSLLVCRFADKRGDRFARDPPSNFVPYVPLFYAGRTHYHLDHAGFVARARNGRPQVVLGSLPSDLPDLLVRSIQRARPRWHIEVTASEDRCNSGGDASFVIAGAIRRTELREHVNFVPLGLLALLGVPHRFVDFVGEFDVEVRRADTGARAWDHSFRVDERRAVGLYYNRHVAQDLFTGLLRATVEQSASGAIQLAERSA